MIRNETYKVVPLDNLKPHPENPRQGDVGAIIASVEAHGFYGAVVAQKSTGHILAGNHRWIAAKHAGLPKIPVLFVDVDDSMARRILIADNRTSDLGTYDDSALVALLRDLAASDAGLAGTGYDGDDLDALLEDLGEGHPFGAVPARVDERDALREKWGVEDGQVWQVGAHRVMCGDSTDAATCTLAAGGITAGMIFTDPPYGVDYDGGSLKRDRIGNDDLKDEALRDFVAAALAGAAAATRRGGAVYCCAPARPLHRYFMAAFDPAGIELRQTIIWVKDNSTFGPLGQDYHWRHEPILYGHVRGAAHVWCGDRTQDTVWEIARPVASEEHPTMKPVDLVERAIRNSTDNGDAVIDPFLGSGTTIVACEQKGRVGVGVEIDPGYVAVTLERLAEMGLTPERVQ